MAKAHGSIQKSENLESPSSFKCFNLLTRLGIVNNSQTYFTSCTSDLRCLGR